MDKQVINFMNKCEAVTGISKSFCEGGFMMYVIAFVGFLTIMLILERTLVLKKMSINKNTFSEGLFGMILRGNIQEAIAFCDNKPSPITNTVKAGLVQVFNKRPDEEVQVAMDASVLRETPKIEGWTTFLAVFGNLSVLLGLLGTIMGLIKSFSGIGEADVATKATLLSKGISEALNCTAFGLMVSIIAIFAYAIFQTLIGRMLGEMTESTMNLMNMVVSNRDKIESKMSQ